MSNIDITEIINTLKNLNKENIIDKNNVLVDKSTYVKEIETDILNSLLKNNKELQRGLLAEYWVMHSNFTEETEMVKDNIILITQFYMSSNINRQKEIYQCLSKNLDNPLIDMIYLITEKEYTDIQLGIKNNSNKSKVKQINIGKRLKYSDVYDIIEEYNLKGYIITSNSDIFFDDTLTNLYKSGSSKKKMVYCQLRFEYTDNDLNKCKIFGPRGDSQDTWIFHSNFNIPKEQRKIFNFELGIPACDNHINYLFSILGYSVHNEPYYIKTYHNHKSDFRTYDSSTKKVVKPWLRVQPVVHKYINDWVKPNENWWRFNILEENNRLFSYLNNKISNNKHFIIPRIAGIENNYVELGICLLQNQINKQQIEYLQKGIYTMKNNAGIKLTNNDSIVKYARLYLQAFEYCDAYFEWEPWGDVYRYIHSSHNFINMNFGHKQQFWAFTLDIFHNIYNNPWTKALKGKRILIISPFIKSMQEKLDILPEIYGVDLFPECEFIFIQPPQTQGDSESEEFDKELAKFMSKIVNIKDKFDIALCSCGGYGNLVCAEIYKLGKSAIYVGGVLQMFFGIYGNRWLKERPDIMRLYMNKHWTRPKEEEQPEGHKKVEGGCYW
tara:strand:- start:646 stop:2475 length:1830 start_codon:yes stop_codon:yes gene_type:complete